MKLSHKLIAGYFAITILFAVGGYVGLDFIRRTLEARIGEEVSRYAAAAMEEIDREIVRRAEELIDDAEDYGLKGIAASSSAEFVRLDRRDAHIERVDRLWREGKDSPLIDEVLGNPLSLRLRKKVEFYREAYGLNVFSELYVTNAFGVVIGSSGRTSDYLQSDEEWYVDAAASTARFWVGGVEYDESSDALSIDVAVNLVDDEGRHTGVYKGVMTLDNVRMVVERLRSRSQYRTLTPYIVDAGGRSILSGVGAGTKRLGRDVRLDEFGVDLSHRAAVARALVEERGYLLDHGGGRGKLSSFKRSEGYGDFAGMGWAIILDIDEDEIFMPLSRLSGLAATVFVMAAGLAVAMGVIIAFRVSRPVEELKEAITATSGGRERIKAPVRSGDEIGLLAAAYNDMLDALTETTVSREYVENILRSMNDSLIVTSRGGKIKVVNRATLDMLGYGADELIGNDIESILAPGGPHPTVLDFLEEGQIKNLKHAYLTRDGRKVPVLLSGSVLRDSAKRYDGVIYTARDMTDLKRMDSSLELIKKALSSITEGVAITDGEARVIWANEAYGDITGSAVQGVIDKVPHFLDAEWQPKDVYDAIWKGIDDNGSWQGEVWERRADGEVVAGFLTVNTIVDEHGEVAHYVAVFYDITEKKRNEERINHLAYYDPLTDLPNRSLLADRLRNSISRSERNGKGFAVLFLDLDNFKYVNDTLGHQAGDVLLKSVARRLVGALRSEDTVCRIGGDEFIIIALDMVSPRSAAVVAGKVLAALGPPFDINGEDVYTTASIGISVYPSDGTDMQGLMMNADTSMYHAKADGKNTFSYYSQEMNSQVSERLRTETEIRRALEKDEFVVDYQPQLDLRTGRIAGMEALVRWRHPEKGLIGPGDFIPIAEETGLITRIDEVVLEKACAQALQWLGISPGLKVSVNVSAVDLRRTDLAGTVEKTLEKTGLPPGALALEVTESAVMENMALSVRTLARLKSIGVSIVMDDFGTGYSSMATLKSLPIDKLKIDKVFVRDVPANIDDAAICRAIIALAHNLGIRVTAEGPEKAEQEEFLRSEGCDEIQGFRFSPPVGAEAATAMLEGKNPMKDPGRRKSV